MRYSKGLRLLLLIGLPSILLLPVLVVMGMKKNRWVNRIVLQFSKYRKLAPYIWAQAKHETADFTSRVYSVDHNMFGMKEATKRKQRGRRGLQSPEGNYYRHFGSDTASLLDLFGWFNYSDFPVSVSSPEEYVEQLRKNWWLGNPEVIGNAPYVAYLKGLKRFI